MGLQPERSKVLALAVNLNAHNGYQTRHMRLDARVVQWLQDHPRATARQFLQYLNQQYSSREMRALSVLPGAEETITMQFYVMQPYRGELFGTHFAYAEIMDPQNTGETEDRDMCPRCGEGLGSLEWLPPHRISLSSTRYPDVLWGAGFNLIVSGRFQTLYEAAGLQGIKRFDPSAEIVKVGKKPVMHVQPPPPAYHNIRYVHGGADLDGQLSGARRPRGLCLYCRQSISALQRVVFRPGSWTAADIFEAYGLPGIIVVTERFKTLVEEHQITNAELIPAEEYRFSQYTL